MSILFEVLVVISVAKTATEYALDGPENLGIDRCENEVEFTGGERAIVANS